MEATPTPIAISEALLTCDVCAELLRGSAVLPCRHVFCSECIRRHLQDNCDCPSCACQSKTEWSTCASVWVLLSTSTSTTISRPPAVINDVNGGDAGRLEVFGDADAFFPCPICSQCVKNRNMDAHISSDCQVHIELNPNSGPSVYALHSIQSSSPLYLNDCKEVVGRNSEKSGSASITSVEVKSTKTIIIDHGSSPIILSKSNSQLMEEADSIDDEFGDVVFSTPVKPTRTTSGISIEDVETTDDESDFQDFIPRKSIRSKRHKSLEPELVVDPVEVSTTSKTMGTPDSRKPKPAVAYDTLKDAQLRKLLKDEGNPQKRHKEYTLLHNANLDTLNPLPQSQILAKMLWRAWNVAAGMGAVAAFHGHAVSKEGTERDVKHMTKYADEFRSLIEGMKERRRLKREEPTKTWRDDGEMVEDDADDDGVR
ncbi:hypothetical protein BCR33DRAFT_717066 [Rhizoclosmatium globosum]|uniref:RING-type domain-containing protein n=1 Tax=Rhizoclosmatium globosum TaxID=329046 RepID=A0A1Y2CC01_9FUNG|nr:hypothetical protein BCR33DRAFT_717066 [Rhizoclosmatium globosum]|eukprot:ORY44558.1 hypothetical protein BCR33DRAFT_717066 [Rhizoclosmatium globosum]